MFDSLEKQIQNDDAAVITRRERIAKALVTVVLSVFLFGSLYFAVRMFD
jgi:hypothetical protein